VNGQRQAVTAVLLVALGAIGCGKKGPPLPPLRALPVAPTELAGRIVGDRVQLRVMVPQASQDPDAPVSVARIDVYAWYSPSGEPPPAAADLIDRDFLVGSIDVRPPVDPDAPPVEPPVDDPRPAPGDIATWSETLPPSLAASPRPGRRIVTPPQRILPVVLPPAGPVLPMPALSLPTRYYVAVGVSARGRSGLPSTVLPVRLGVAPAPPADPVLTSSEQSLTLTWTAPAGTAVSVYASTPAGVEEPRPVQPTPFTTGTWSAPVVFGQQRCFTVRSVVTQGNVSYESAPVGPACATPLDVYPPAAPGPPLGVVEEGRIVIDWPAAAATDLAGYHVLRGEGPGATLQQLTQTPVQGTQYVDRTTRPGVQYVYVVVAVDAAGNVSPQSPQLILTGR